MLRRESLRDGTGPHETPAGRALDNSRCHRYGARMIPTTKEALMPTCPLCPSEVMDLTSDVDDTVELVCPTHGRVEDHGFRLVLIAEDGTVGTAHLPRLNHYDSPFCPCCGHDDIGMWAHDGEADLADWWSCDATMGGCGAMGACTTPTDTTVTQNGVALSAFVAA